MMPAAASTQVRQANFSNEIPDGISSSPWVLYRTGSQDEVESFGYTLMFNLDVVLLGLGSPHHPDH
jgi:hypothetical protein